MKRDLYGIEGLLCEYTFSFNLKGFHVVNNVYSNLKVSMCAKCFVFSHIVCTKLCNIKIIKAR